ncbi:aromatic ring-hydroxylating dioxygenase subunit alpha [Iodidimonas sp. SYSU 1G8]|uniref:aromatic ring-hydroxylating oxygenase subunit alpha n=1 Tax=Iodidimonas sp. SYSU 1G8 TaxID=3133967 RepID=UPI0031FEC49D
MVAVVRIKDSVGTVAEKAPEPDLGTELIPQERYISRDFMQLEWDRMWTKVWLIGCREEEIPDTGDYITTEIGNESLLIVRGEDGKARTFYNVCNHRGNQVKFDKCGNSRTLQCAYHFWEYDLTGRLVNVPDEEDFHQGCPKDVLSLKEIRTDVWGGFVWYNLNPDAEPLMEYLGVVPAHLEAYHFEKMVMTLNVTMEWDCNWKTSVDAFNEVYHVQCIHPELLYDNDDVDVQIDLYERHNRYLVPFHTYSPRLGEDLDEVPEIIASKMTALGMNPDEFKGRVSEARRAIQVFKRENQEALGVDYSELNDDQLTDDYHYNIFPNLTLNIFADRMMMFRQRPHESDPNKMYYDVTMYARLKKGQARPPLPDHEQHKHGGRSLGLVLDQDSVNLPHVQKGNNSSAFKGLHISHQERRIRHMHKTLMDYINGVYANDA